MPEPNRYFKFLQLPRELRDAVYEHTLCSFSQFRGRYNIEQCAAVYSKAVFERRHFTGNLILLLANKQSHDEGYECMLAKNPFVLIECRNVSLKSSIYGHLPPILVLSSRFHWEPELGRINAYPWYTMRLRVDEKERSFRSGVIMPGPQCFDAVMLWEDCIDMFKRFGVHLAENYLPDQKGGYIPERAPLKIMVELSPKEKGWDSENSYTAFRASHSAIDQRKLLQPVKDGFRACDDFEVKGCNDEALAAEVIQEVSKHPSISLLSFQSHLDEHAYRAETAWELGEITDCAQICAEGIEIVHRVRYNAPLMRQLHNDGLEHNLHVGRASHTLHFLLARCVHAHLSAPVGKRIEADDYTHIANISKALRNMFQWYESGVWGLLPEHHPSAHEEAEECYMRATAIRLSREYCKVVRDDDPVEYIEKALRLWPGNYVFEVEERKAKVWVQDNDRYIAWLRTIDPRDFLTMAQWRAQIDRTAFDL